MAPGDDDVGCAVQVVKQRKSGGLVRGLARTQRQADRQALLIHDRIDPGAQSATRATDGVIFAPFLPEAAC